LPFAGCGSAARASLVLAVAAPAWVGIALFSGIRIALQKR